MLREFVTTAVGVQVFVTVLLIAMVVHGQSTFDVPATVAAQEVTDQSGPTKVIRIRVPVTFVPPASDRWTVQELEIEVRWMRNAAQVTRFEPTTQVDSEIAGTVKVEERKDNTASIGINLSSGHFEPIKGSANAQASHLNGRTVRFEEVPQHHPTITAGTIERGTGVRFAFHPSRTSTLEGQRELTVEFEVPNDWRMGLLKIHTRARVVQSVLGGITDKKELAEAFVVPVYLDGDESAWQAARQLVAAERQLRQQWYAYRKQSAGRSNTPRWLAELLDIDKAGDLPNEWLYALIQSGNDELATKIGRRLPDELKSMAEAYVAARQKLLGPELH